MRTTQFYYFLKDYIKKNGNNIVPKELAYHFKVYHSSIYSHLKKLEEQGKIKRKKDYIEIVGEE